MVQWQRSQAHVRRASMDWSQWTGAAAPDLGRRRRRVDAHDQCMGWRRTPLRAPASNIGTATSGIPWWHVARATRGQSVWRAFRCLALRTSRLGTRSQTGCRSGDQQNESDRCAVHSGFSRGSWRAVTVDGRPACDPGPGRSRPRACRGNLPIGPISLNPSAASRTTALPLDPGRGCQSSRAMLAERCRRRAPPNREAQWC
jgi:hypothetical protein